MVETKNPFVKLNAEEWDELLLMPVWISLLIAGSDNIISKSERKKAEKIIQENAKIEGLAISDFCKQAAEKFAVNLKGYKTLLPQDLTLRTNFLVAKLSRANDLFRKLPIETSIELYENFRRLSTAVAKTTGGLFGILSVSYSESRWIDLKMIHNPAESDEKIR